VQRREIGGREIENGASVRLYSPDDHALLRAVLALKRCPRIETGISRGKGPRGSRTARPSQTSPRSPPLPPSRAPRRIWIPRERAAAAESRRRRGRRGGEGRRQWGGREQRGGERAAPGSRRPGAAEREGEGAGGE